MFKLPFSLEKKILINKSLIEVRDLLSDFNNWNLWSPWNCLDNSTRLTIKNPPKQIGHSQSWVADLIGSGEQTITCVDNQKIEINLSFLKPHKSQSKVRFHLNPIDNQTEVTWVMECTLPFFLFFMKSRMQAYIGADFERGLIRLKEFAETQTISSKTTEVESILSDKTIYYIGTDIKCSIDEMPEKMTAAYDQLLIDLEKNKVTTITGCIALYHNFDLVKGTTHLNAGFTSNSPISSIAGYVNGDLKPHKALTLKHTGPYLHLPTAWSKLFCYQMGKKIKLNKDLPMYELYLNNPKFVSPNDILTEIRLPVK